MSQSLNDLFSALVQSEQAAEAEKNKYQQAKRNIQLNSEKLKKETTRKAEVAEEIQVLETTLDGIETVAEEVKLKETFMKETTSKIRSENMDKTNTLADLRDSWKMQSMQLMKQVKEFSEKYGLSSNSREKRLESARSNLKKVTVEIDSVQHEIEEKKTRLAEINELLAKREELAAANEKLVAVENDIQVGIREEDVQIRQLERENLTLQVAPECGEEFVQVNNDLDKYKTDKLESRAEELHAQLSEVTDKLRRQEGQTLRLQYRRWQRHRQLKHTEIAESQGNHTDQLANDRDRHNVGLPHRKGFQPQHDPLEISTDGNEMEPLGYTDRPGFGMSAHEAFSQHGEICSKLSLQAEGIRGKTKTADLEGQQERKERPGYIDEGGAYSENQGGTVNVQSSEDSLGTRQPDGEEIEQKKKDECLMVFPQEGEANLIDDSEPTELDLIFSQDDILCPSASTVSETAVRSNKESLDGTSQNTIFISSPI